MNDLWSCPGTRAVGEKCAQYGLASGENYPLGLQFWLGVLSLCHKTEDFVNWLRRFYYAQHNARVIEDFENRMSFLVCLATGQWMSKPYYTIEEMRAQVNNHHQREYAYGYNDGIDDCVMTVRAFMQGDHPESIAEALLEMKDDEV